MSEDERAQARPVDPAALVSAAAGIVAALGAGAPAIAGVLAVVAISLALVSRRRLRRDASLRGARAGVVGVVLGIGVLAVAIVPWLLVAAFTLLL